MKLKPMSNSNYLFIIKLIFIFIFILITNGGLFSQEFKFKNLIKVNTGNDSSESFSFYRIDSISENRIKLIQLIDSSSFTLKIENVICNQSKPLYSIDTIYTMNSDTSKMLDWYFDPNQIVLKYPDDIEKNNLYSFNLKGKMSNQILDFRILNLGYIGRRTGQCDFIKDTLITLNHGTIKGYIFSIKFTSKDICNNLQVEARYTLLDKFPFIYNLTYFTSDKVNNKAYFEEYKVLE